MTVREKIKEAIKDCDNFDIIVCYRNRVKTKVIIVQRDGI